MFYEGDLQTGIALAVQESKCVVCFVRDDGEESSKWETEWLAGNERIVNDLKRNAVTLRLQAGSQEAGFLSSFYPVASVPALVMIDQGKVEQTLLSGVEHDAFTPALIGALSRIEHRKTAARSQAAAASSSSPLSSAQHTSTPPSAQHTSSPQPTLSDSSSQAGTPQSSQETYPTTQASTPPSSQEAQQTTRAGTPQSSQPQTTQAGPTPSERQARIQALLEERRQRLEADKKAKDTAEKGKQKERALAREGDSSTPGKRTAEQTYAQQQKQAKLEALKEKERIRKLVELDKLERKEREEQRRAQARAEREAAAQPQDDEDATRQPSPTGVDRKGCMVQVRLLDGSTMRASFFPEDKPGQALRSWIDKNRTDGDYPYTFKQIMTPAPSKAISDADEKLTLRELGLTPSTSLVLIPVRGVVAAYRGGGAGGLLHSILAIFSGLFMGLFDALFRLMQNVMGVGNGDNSTQPHPQAGQDPASSSSKATAAVQPPGGEASTGVNIRTLQDQRDDKEDHQLYNGNSLDFEPRKDDSIDSKEQP